MPRLTILNHWSNPVEIVILNVVTVTLAPGEKLERDLNGPVQLRARATGNDRNFIRDGDSADGLGPKQSAHCGGARSKRRSVRV